MDRAAFKQTEADRQQICASCDSNRHGGCVEPKSPLMFDEQPDPYGHCERWQPLNLNTKRIQGGLR